MPVVFRACERCGSSFAVARPSYPARFCSLSCSSRRPLGDRMTVHHGVDPKAKRRAHSFIQGRIRIGMIARPGACELCGKACKPAGAHIDYDRPHVVAWLCAACHVGSHHRPDLDARVRDIARPRGPAPMSDRYALALAALPKGGPDAAR